MTHGDRLARRYGRAARNLFAEWGEPIFGLKLANDNASANEWGIKGHEGGMQTCGIGGSLTGRGAHCVAEGAIVDTDRGPMHIEDLQLLASPCKILSYAKGKIEYQPMQALLRSEGRNIIRITTSSGRTLDVTPEHRVFSDGGYIEAKELSAGDRLLLAMRKERDPSGISDIQIDQEGTCRLLLLCKVQPESPCDKKSASMSDLSESSRKEDAEVLRAMQAAEDGQEAGSSSDYENLSDLQQEVSGEMAGCSGRSIRDVLQQVVCGARPFPKNVCERESEVEAWLYSSERTAPFCQGISFDEAAHSGERRQEVRGLSVKEEPARPSHRRMADEQRRIESGDALRQVSQAMAFGQGFEAIEDTVAVVEDLCQTATVYDIQVAENHNFFANGILVHNCLIIDDPVKNAEDAASEVIREKAWDWFQSTAMTRLEPGGAVIVNMTRWHKDDLVGRILESDDADEWQRIRFPAIAEGADELGRKAGEALWPERYPLQTTILPSGRRLRGLEAIRDAMPLYWWMALYQQQPTQHASVEWPDSYFDWDGFRFDRWPSDVVLKAVSLDPSKGKTKHSDYSAFILLGQDTRGEIWCDADLQRRPATVIAEDGAALMRTFRPQGFICESNAWQDLLAIPFGPYFNTPELSGVEVCWFNNVVAKEIRIRRLDPLLRSRKFHVRNSPSGNLLVSQLRQFPMAEHDDGPDALEMATQMLAYLKTGQPIESRGIEQNLAWSSNTRLPT